MNGHLEQIRTFLAVADQSGFAKAAVVLGTSPSSITRAVAELEKRLGVQLLKRTTRRVSLTQAGQNYADRTRAILAELDQIDDSTRAFQTALQGHLSVSAPLSFGTHFLAGPIADFRKIHPGVRLSISLTDQFVDIMQEDFDMALRISAAPSDLSTIWRKMRLVRRSLVASPDYLSAQRPATSPRDLRDHDCLSYTTNLADTDTWQLTNNNSGVTIPAHVRFAFASDNGDLLAQMAIAGQGIALLPDFIVAQAIDSGQLVRVLPTWSPPEIWLTAYFPPYQKLPAAVEAFTICIESSVSELQL